MGRKQRLLYTIDDLCAVCGFFNSETDVNNGYGCNHPEQEETDTDRKTGKEQGKCYHHSCPLGMHLYPQSDPYYRKYFDNRGGPGSPNHWSSMSDDEWIRLYKPLTLRSNKLENVQSNSVATQQPAQIQEGGK